MTIHNKLNNFQEGEMKVNILGGVHQTNIGRNCMAITNEWGEIILIDCGVLFGNPQVDGYHLALPDMNFINKNIKNILGIFWTHTHEDHSGAIKHIYNYFDAVIPSYSSEFAKKFMTFELQHDMKDKHKLHDIMNSFHTVNDGDEIRIGNFIITPIATIHSAPFSLMFHITTVQKKYFILHTGDYRMDLYLDNEESRRIVGYTNFAALAQLGVNKQVDCLFADSTRCGQDGIGTSEKTIIDSITNIFDNHREQRIVLTCFGSTTGRVLNIAKLAAIYGRRVVVLGYSMKKSLKTAESCGMLSTEELFYTAASIKNTPNEKLLILVSGSQGDIGSALDQLVNDLNPNIILDSHDVVVFSADIIPGNENNVYNVLETLLSKNITIYHPKLTPSIKLHGTGHCYKIDTLMLFNLVKPKHFIPIHGNGLQLYENKQNALDYGLPEDKIFIVKNGYEIMIGEEIRVTEGQISEHYLDGDGYEINPAELTRRRNVMKNGFILITISNKTEVPNIVRFQQFFTSNLFQNIPMEMLQKNLSQKFQETIDDRSYGTLYKCAKYSIIKTFGCDRKNLPEIKIILRQ